MARLTRVQVASAAAFWLVVSGLYAMQIWWLATRPGDRINVTSALVWTVGFYLLWLPLTLVVWRLPWTWTPGTLGWPAYLGRHLLFGAMLAVLHNAAVIAVAMSLVGAPGRETFFQMLLMQLRSRSYFELVIYAGVVATGQAIALSQRVRERETQAARLETELASARLGALQAQIHPHFLFNSLHAIASLARDRRHDDVVRMVADLSELLRQVLEQEHRTLPVRAELDLARRYLAIQEVRFEGRLSSAFEIDETVADVHVPALTLQPLVDNAVRHGLAPSVQGGVVRVRAKEVGGHLVVTVEDNGVGPPAGWSMDTTAGTGLRNLRSRLQILCDRASLTAGAGPAGGFIATVTVPR